MVRRYTEKQEAVEFTTAVHFHVYIPRFSSREYTILQSYFLGESTLRAVDKS